MDDVISIVKKNQVDSFFNCLDSVDLDTKLTTESSGIEGGILFLDNKSLLNRHHPTVIYRKPTHTDYYLDLNPNHTMSAN